MRREILDYYPGDNTTGCCPGHDNYPNQTYRSRRSKRARARDKKKEHQHARTAANRAMMRELLEMN